MLNEEEMQQSFTYDTHIGKYFRAERDQELQDHKDARQTSPYFLRRKK